MVFIYLGNALNLSIFIHAPVLDSKLQAEFFENLFPPTEKGWENYDLFYPKFNQKMWRWLGTLGYLYFIWLLIFLNVMALQFGK